MMSEPTQGGASASTLRASPPRQLVLDLRHRPALEAEDFLVTPSTEAAVAMVDRWPNWTHWATLVQGPKRSGKTHLVNVWRARSGAAVVPAAQLSDQAVDLLRAQGAIAIENLERGIADERALFHVLNVAREEQRTVLLTSEKVPADLVVRLPDLRSRLRALPVVAIGAPDDQLLRLVLVKLFADRQVIVDPSVVDYLALHMERSLAEAHRLVEALDRRALSVKRRLTRALAAEVLAGGLPARGLRIEDDADGQDDRDEDVGPGLRHGEMI
jgi:chromosomal replication initiation ATPase DnaA